MQARPGFWCVKRVVRIRETDPAAKRFTLIAAMLDPLDRAVGRPGGVVIGGRQFRMPNLCRTFRVARVFPHRLRAFITTAIHVIPAFVVLTCRWLFGCPPVVPNQHEFNMFKAHIGAKPILGIAG